MRETKSLPTQTVLSCAIILPLFRNSFFFVHLFGNARMLHQSKALIIRELVRGFLHVSLTWPGGRSPVSNTIGPIPNVPGDMPIPSPHFTSSCECWTKHQTSRLTATSETSNSSWAKTTTFNFCWLTMAVQTARASLCAD